MTRFHQRAMSDEPRAVRLLRERLEAQVELPIKGFGISIDFLDGYAADARILDRSPVLYPEKALSTEGNAGDRRRFGFVEFAGGGKAPPRNLMRYVGDVFCADARTAEFVWQAVIEKIENDAR